MQGASLPVRKRTTVTFSLNDDLLQYIGNEARQKGISLNSHVNTILSKYIKFYKSGEELSIQTIPKTSFLFYINHIDDLEHAEHIENHLFELIQVLFHERKIPLTLENIINVFFNDIAINSGAMNSINNYVDNEGSTIIVVKHSYNIKWSNTNCLAFKRLFERLFHYHIEYEALPNSYVLRILEKNIS